MLSLLCLESLLPVHGVQDHPGDILVLIIRLTMSRRRPADSYALTSMVMTNIIRICTLTKIIRSVFISL
jgi:hypothetical protein